LRANRPSSTALLIAKSACLLSRNPRFCQLIPPEAAELSERFVMAASGGGTRFMNALRWPWFRAAAFLIERLVLPGIQVHYALRKRLIEELVRQRLEDGARQVIVLGAGVDTLAYRLHREFPEVIFIEVDHPATQRVKVDVLAGAVGSNLAVLPLDISTQDSREALVKCPDFRPDADTLLIAEGLLMYLEASAVDRIMRMTAEHPGSSAIIFTFMEPRPDGRVAFQHSGKLVDWWLRRRGEPFRWGVRREELSGFLAARGLVLQLVATPDELRRRYLSNPAIDGLSSVNGDYVCAAIRR